MAMRKLFVHCGVHRTGTTLIQSYFAKNRESFARAGVIYPFDEENHQFLVGKIRRGELDPQKLIELIGSIPAPDDSSILLSGEDFCSIESRDWLTALASSFETRVIFYMRRQDLWMNSWYNQNIKWPWDRRTDHLSPYEFLELIDEYFWLDYDETLERFSASVGRENLLLGVVEKAQVRDVVPDFLTKIGIAQENAPAIENGKSNESIPPLAAEVLRHLDLLSLQPKERYQLICKITELTNRIAPHQSMMVFSPDERRAMLARFAASNARVARNYFGRADGRLFLDSDISDADPYTHAELPPPDELLRAVVAPLLKSTIGPAVMMSAQAEPPPSPVPPGFHPVVRASREAAGGSWDLAGSALTYLETIRHFDSVAEVGCGTAEWLHVAAAKGAKRIKGYDFAGLDLRARKLEAGDFIETDFSTALVAEPRFDLAVAVGVAERIPRDRAETFVESLANLSDWIVFCAALPYQGGNHILNANWLEYWARRFFAEGYLCYDILRPKFWANTKLPSYFRQSAVLFVKAGSRAPLAAQGFTPTATPVTMIHPEHYLKAASIPARAMPGVIRNLESWLALGESTKPRREAKQIKDGPMDEKIVSRIRRQAWNSRTYDIPRHALSVPTMLTREEGKMLCWIGEHCYSGAGAVVDLGSFLGGSSVRLASGLQRSGHPWRMDSYDQFEITEDLKEQYLYKAGHEKFSGSDMLPVFMEHTKPFEGRIVPHKGRLEKFQWSGEPIQILFIDIAKSVDTNNFILSQYFPHLIPGNSIVIQQDYLTHRTPWLVTTMEGLADKLELVGWTAENSTIYFCKEAISAEDVRPLDFRALTQSDVEKAFMSARDRFPFELQREMIEAALKIYLANPKQENAWAFPAVLWPRKWNNAAGASSDEEAKAPLKVS